MVLYVILVFAAILIGMAISVFAFGTGGKRSRVFQDIYFTVEEVEGIGVLYTKNGDYSAVLAMENPVQKYSANIDAYYEFTSLLTSLTQTLGEGYALHKQDIFCRRRFKDPEGGSREFLSDCYFRYFEGREYTDALTYLVITHCFRHTFATLQVNEGTDIYTVSHLLTHANVGTTQIYADIVDKSMRDAVERIKIKDEAKPKGKNKKTDETKDK